MTTLVGLSLISNVIVVVVIVFILFLFVFIFLFVTLKRMGCCARCSVLGPVLRVS